MSRNREAVKIVWLALVLTAAFGLFVRLARCHAELAESNFQANLIRLQTFLFGPPPRAIIVGSSFSGRLLPSYFEGTELAPLANVGLDGSGPLFGLDLVRTRPPAIILVEANTLLRPPNENDAALDAALRSLQFRLSRYLPLLQAQWRPSSMLYDWFKQRQKVGEGGREAEGRGQRTGVGSQEAGVRGQETNFQARNTDIEAAGTKHQMPNTEDVVQRPVPAFASPTNPPIHQSINLFPQQARLRGLVAELQGRGCKVVLVRLPAGRSAGPGANPNFELADSLAREFNLVQIDLAAECSRRGRVLAYTDGQHLAPAPAREVSRLLAELVAGGGGGSKR
jgi:hypothetical protein